MAIALDILCFLLIMVVIVVVHEGGHALAARLCGVRVTEFFVGLPFGPRVGRRTRRGTTVGCTVALLGGYTRIAGMLPQVDENAALALSVASARGSVSQAELEQALGYSADDASFVLEQLVDFGSLEPVGADGEPCTDRRKAVRYAALPRDDRGLTQRERHSDPALAERRVGEPYRGKLDGDALLAGDRTYTFYGVSLPKRLLMLVAGVAANLLLGLAIFTLYYMLHGVPGVTSYDVIGVQDSSPAAEAGMVVGDRVVSIDGKAISDYYELSDALEAASKNGGGTLEYLHDGKVVASDFTLDETGRLGVTYQVGLVTFGLGESLLYGSSYIVEVAKSVVSLLDPAQVGEVLESSAGVVGIASLTHDAVSEGFWTVLLLLGMLSVSLGWLNLLPIPPLDGGKVLVELVQKLLGRNLSLTTVGALNVVGMAALMLLFVFMVFQDVGRLAGI